MKDISLHILDIVQNSISAKATIIQVEIKDSIKDNIYKVSITDNGKGIPAHMLETITDPWTTTRITRKVGLGIPLFKQNAELTGGNFSIDSKLGKGTWLTVNFVNNHIDCLPPGDIVGVYLMLVTANPTLDFIFSQLTDNGKYVFDTKEIKQALEGMPINQPEIRQFLKEMLSENLEALRY